jgi:rhamnosyltransferase
MAQAARPDLKSVKAAKPGPLSDVCAVVVTADPGPDTARNLSYLAPQVRELMIVDNGSQPRTFAPIEAAALRLGCATTRFGCNLGVAAALNFALERARHHGFKWLATFDQDSRPSSAMLEQMLKVLDDYPDRDQVALVTPVQFEESLGIPSIKHVSLKEGPTWRQLPTAISPGNLLSVEAALSVGGFDASLFIDYVDHELCMRLRRRGYQILEASHVRLMQAGQMEVRQLLGKKPRISHHPRSRRYYITRNRALLWRTHLFFDPKWVGADMRNFFYDTLAIMLFEKDVPGKLWMMARGLLDAVRNARGPLPGHGKQASYE